MASLARSYHQRGSHLRDEECRAVCRNLHIRFPTIGASCGHRRSRKDSQPRGQTCSHRTGFPDYSSCPSLDSYCYDCMRRVYRVRFCCRGYQDQRHHYACLASTGRYVSFQQRCKRRPLTVAPVACSVDACQAPPISSINSSDQPALTFSSSMETSSSSRVTATQTEDPVSAVITTTTVVATPTSSAQISSTTSTGSPLVITQPILQSTTISTIASSPFPESTSAYLQVQVSGVLQRRQSMDSFMGFDSDEQATFVACPLAESLFLRRRYCYLKRGLRGYRSKHLPHASRSLDGTIFPLDV